MRWNFFNKKFIALFAIKFRNKIFRKFIADNNKNIISKVIEYLEDKGWVDDEKFCLAFGRDQINRNNIGPIALKYKLKAHIDSLSLIEELSDRIYSELNIENIIMKVLVKCPPEKIKKEEILKRKIINRLKRKGHYWQDIDETLKKYLNLWLKIL